MAEKHFFTVLRIASSVSSEGDQSNHSEDEIPVIIQIKTNTRAEICSKQSNAQQNLLEYDHVCKADDSSYKKFIFNTVENALTGFHATIIAAGVDGSHDRSFLSHPSNGVVNTAIGRILKCLKKSQKSHHGSKLVVLCSYLLLANEQAYDLLTALVVADNKITEKRGTGVCQDGSEIKVRLVQATTLSDVAAMLSGGEAAVKKLISGGQTYHTIFTIRVEYAQFGSMAAPVSGTLSLVDIGAMDAHHQSQDNAFSTRSLSGFMATLKTISTTTGLPPLLPNKSLLPEFLKESLGGNCKTLLILSAPEHINPTSLPGVLEAMMVVSRARFIENKPDRSELARKALMNAYMKELRRIHESSAHLEGSNSNREPNEDIQRAAKALLIAAKDDGADDSSGEEDEEEGNDSSKSLEESSNRLKLMSEENTVKQSQPQPKGAEDITVDALVAIIQDPDKGVPRAAMTALQDTKSHRGKGAVFTGSAIVSWLTENMAGIENTDDAQRLGQILLDKGAIFHSEGSSVFANAESLCYYAREPRSGAKLLSMEEICALLSANREDSVAHFLIHVPGPDNGDVPMEETDNNTTQGNMPDTSLPTSENVATSPTASNSLNGTIPPSGPVSPAASDGPSSSTFSSFISHSNPTSPLSSEDKVLEPTSPLSFSEDKAQEGDNTSTADNSAVDEETPTAPEGVPDTGPVQRIPVIDKNDSYPHPLHYAVAIGKRSGVLEHLINWYGVDKKDDQNRTPLMFSALNNKTSACQVLINAGSLLDHRDNSGLTALHIACHKGSKDVTKVLLHKHANTAISDKMGHNALHWATVPADPGCVKELLKYCHPRLAHCEDKGGLTPMHWAVYSDHTEHLKLLLQWSSSDIDDQDSSGRTLLTYAIQSKAINSTKVLLQFVPKLLRISDKHGLTPLHLAASQSSPEFITCVMKALTETHPPSIAALNSQDNKGRTPLHYATVYNNKLAVKLLVDSGAKTTSKDCEMKGPLEIADEFHVDVDEEIVTLLNRPVLDLNDEDAFNNRKNKSAMCNIL